MIEFCCIGNSTSKHNSSLDWIIIKKFVGICTVTFFTNYCSISWRSTSIIIFIQNISFGFIIIYYLNMLIEKDCSSCITFPISTCNIPTYSQKHRNNTEIVKFGICFGNIENIYSKLCIGVITLVISSCMNHTWRC